MRAPTDAEGKARPRQLWALGSALLLVGFWACASTYVLLFHDDALAQFVARQSAMQAVYDRQLSDLRDQLQRGRGESALTQAALAARVATAFERQAELERRQAAILNLRGNSASREPEYTGSIPPASVPSLDGLGLRGGDTHEEPARLDKRSARETGIHLAALEMRLDGLSAAQSDSLEHITARVARSVDHLRRVIGRTGVDPGRFEARERTGIGGPLVPIAADPFTQAFTGAQRALDDSRRLRGIAAALPLARPIRAETVASSHFGPRIDPFTRGIALHTGIDLKAEFGEPARATAQGRVSMAEASGGYGNLVEIDHGHGLTTRFAHLGRIEVQPGQLVRAGAIVGRVGSTGRSTGAHLHYETRIDGEPVDPQRFLDAGRMLSANSDD